MLFPMDGGLPEATGEAGAAPYATPALITEEIARSIPAVGMNFDFIIFPISVVCYLVLRNFDSVNTKCCKCFAAIAQLQNTPPFLAQGFDFVLIFLVWPWASRMVHRGALPKRAS